MITPSKQKFILENWYKLSARKIAKEIGTSDVNVLRHAKNLGLPARKSNTFVEQLDKHNNQKVLSNTFETYKCCADCGKRLPEPEPQTLPDIEEIEMHKEYINIHEFRPKINELVRAYNQLKNNYEKN